MRYKCFSTFVNMKSTCRCDMFMQYSCQNFVRFYGIVIVYNLHTCIAIIISLFSGYLFLNLSVFFLKRLLLRDCKIRLGFMTQLLFKSSIILTILVWPLFSRFLFLKYRVKH